MKRLFITLAILSVCQIAGAVDVNSLDPNLYLQKIKELKQITKAQQQEIDRLTAALVDVRKQLAEQIKENERPKALSTKGEIKPTAPAQVNLNPVEANDIPTLGVYVTPMTKSLRDAIKKDAIKDGCASLE